MELQGKKVVFLGDSITEGTGATDVEHRYTNVFARIAECEIFVDGIGGTRIARQTIPTNERWDKDFNGRADALPDNADIVVVFGGTNDFGHGDAPLGTFGDETVYTFYGALRVLCEKLIAKYPYATVVFMTPLHRLTENETVNKYGQPTPPLIEYVKAIRQVCEQYSLPVLDLFKVSGMQPSVEIIQQTYMPDGLHPSNAGAEKIAKLLYQFLRNL
ncbi:MAG: SGNH/GDSL hydrolase family protein [Clostridia bacterium]|nr:SGNH/GDSL hydrolase family protein [Clostridia bacterium]